MSCIPLTNSIDSLPKEKIMLARFTIRRVYLTFVSHCGDTQGQLQGDCASSDKERGERTYSSVGCHTPPFSPHSIFALTTCNDICEPMVEGPHVMHLMARDIRTTDLSFLLRMLFSEGVFITELYVPTSMYLRIQEGEYVCGLNTDASFTTLVIQ